MIAHLVQSCGCYAVFALVALESLGMPLPGESALIAAALYAGTTHHLNVAALAGSNEPYQAAAGEVRDAEIVHAIAPDAAIRGPAYSAAFHAITMATNIVQFPMGTITGYRAASGWNPVTGWGSPDAQVLIRFFVRYG
jgi:hypothetical protein